MKRVAPSHADNQIAFLNFAVAIEHLDHAADKSD
jgi:hypothetical protein